MLRYHGHKYVYTDNDPRVSALQRSKIDSLVQRSQIYCGIRAGWLFSAENLQILSGQNRTKVAIDH